MSPELQKVLLLLAVCIGMFVMNKPRLDVVGLLAILALPLLGLISVQDALAGFSNPSVVLIGALFVISEGIVRTGIAHKLGDVLVRKAGNSQTRLIVWLMLAVVSLGSFMSSTGTVAIFIPVVLNIASRLQISPRSLMMPLSVAALLSGMQTLVATSPNMIVDSALREAGHTSFRLFTFTPIGVVILAVGIVYMLLTRNWLIKRDDSSGNNRVARRTLNDMATDYGLHERVVRLRIVHGSSLIGRPLRDLELRRRHHLNIIGVERRARYYQDLLNPTLSLELKADDVLLVHLLRPESEIPEVLETLSCTLEPLASSSLSHPSREVGMAEIVLPPNSSLIGKDLLDLDFRRKQQLTVLGLRRNGMAMDGEIVEEKLRVGDILLVVGPWRAIRRMQSQPNDFLMLMLPAEIDQVAPAYRKWPFGLLSLATMVILMATGVVPNVFAAMIACLMMGVFRCVDLESAYRAIHWPTIILVAGMIPFASALQQTGGVEVAASGLTSVMEGASPRLILMCLFAMTAITGLFIPNTVTAVLMAPVALAVAHQVGAAPQPFAMIVALASSSAFITPISSPVNTLVMGPGQYQFSDFVKVGIPLTVLVMLTAVLIVPVLLPF